MTREELVAECRKRSAHERHVAKEYVKMKGRGYTSTANTDKWAEECEQESKFFDSLAEALRGED